VRGRVLRTLALALGLVSLASPAVALEEPEEKESKWHLGAEVATNFPLDVAPLRLTFETPPRIRLTTSIGVLPDPYIDLVNSVLVSAGAFNETTAEVIDDALGGSLVWRIQAGWRPLRNWGFYGDVGYQLMTLGGEVTALSLLEIATGREVPSEFAAGFVVDSMLHMLVVELGYEWVIVDHLMIRFAIGYAGTMTSSTQVEPNFQPPPILQNTLDEFSRVSADYLDDTYQTFVHTPTLTLGIGYRFF
jgi:hypothetical protein